VAPVHEPGRNGLLTRRAVLPFALPRVMFCVDDNYRCQLRPRRAGVALQKPAALQPFLGGEAIDDVLITAVDPRSLVPDGTPVIQPRGCDRLDVGISLAVLVAGGPSPVVRGCFAVLDFARGDVPGNQTYLARSFATHTVVSTTVAPPAVLDNELTLALSVDEEELQCGRTASMIADVGSLIRTIGRHYQAEHEWLLLTGSPAGRPADRGTGWLRPGATVCGEIGGVGSVTAQVMAEAV